ncbi:hypothetical protein [Sinanaerobacter chloroacetimidivorans]|uniref:Peptidase M14 carboxypeptidase A domain-containing protein n=1 Tax=Sinanaerobacter chloroacetimidivorans TaxID=2818044 RepID=A0A8J7W3H6_9FIRM|nr:hypothetical protein [Sinanaerobacter chloroacetimidivorans]MBR0599824.1 hypothetical protein [Sinanaerobacter chloroacetimidivorans]
MQLKKIKKFLSVLIVLSLVFSLGINTYAVDDSPAYNAAILLENNADLNEVTPGALEVEPPAGPDAVTTEALDLVTPEALNLVTPEALDFVTPEALEVVTPEALALALENNRLYIKSVEVINGGPVQILYRPEVYRGVSESGEDPDKYYTTRREINLKDPRIFHVEFTVPAEGITDPQAFLDTVNFTYGGFALNRWGNGSNLRGTTPIMLLLNKQIVAVADGYKVSASIRVNSPYGSSNANATSNIPYNGYNGGTQGDFGSGQTADNRAFFQFGPTYEGPGTYALEAVADGQTLAAASLHIGPYDEYHSWIEINEFCQDLIEAITGERADVDAKPLGVLAAGTVVKNADGKFESGDGVYVEVSILGYGLTDNYSGTNANYNNYSQFNPIWNVVVAKDGKTVDDYLKPGGLKDQMNDNPQALIDKYINADPEDIDFVTPFYQNNVHSDEVSGTDSMIHLINALIDGGNEGKTLSYKTFDDGQITWNYRPSSNTNTGYTAFNHVVNAGQFSSDTSRTEMSIDTGEILDKFIMVNTLCSNPDGKAAMRRVNRYGMDLNRDAVYATQPETIALTQDIAKWDPIVMLEWHGYVSQMLIEPCTPPHSQNYEPDLTLNNMIQLAYSGGKALTASTGYNRFHLPWDSMANGWDDGGNIYGPMFAMLFGCMGWTIELPHSNSDAFEAGNAINYAMLNALLEGDTAYYDGNVLNRSIDGKDSHAVDNKYTSLRKSTILNKLEFKLRGVENIDSQAADKYFIDVVSGVGKYVGRARKDDGNGGKLPFFPDYLVIPGTPETQFNVAEAYRTLDFTMRYGAKVSKTTEPVTYNGVTYPAGTYLYDMKQGRRNFIAEIMSKGYDATNFASMYADIYCNFPDTRGFDCVEVWSPDLFDGKTVSVDSVEKKANIAGAPDEYVVFKSNSVDSVRFVNLLLSGRSSGPSFINSKEDVWMLRKSAEGVGTMSDYIIEAKNLDKIYALVDNPDLGLKGCHLEGKYISALPKEAVKLVEPVISLNSTRNAATVGGAIYWALDDYMGFGSMKNADGTDYNGNSASAVRPGANVVLMNNAAASGNLLTAIKNNKLGLVMVQSAASLTNANFGTGTSSPTTGSFGDVALYGDYNVDDSLFTANYASTDTIYARGNYFTGNIPEGSKILFKSKDGGAFIGGFQATGGSKDIFQNRTTMFSTILKGGGIAGKPVQSVTFGSNMFFRPHYQKYYPMLATAIFAGAAGILDDQIDPVINSIEFGSSDVVVSASDADSGMAAYALYKWDIAAKKYVLEAEQADGTFALASVESRYMIVATDYAGNEAVGKFAFINGTFFVYGTETAAPSAVIEKLSNNKNSLTVTVTETFFKEGNAVFNRGLAKKFSIDNNAAGTYDVEGYKVYVDTKGNTQVRECKITNFTAQ